MNSLLQALSPIEDLKGLVEHLQVALQIEHATVPPYLAALYSIHEGTNLPAVRIMRSVVMEEMLHMVLVSNVMNAIGGSPDLLGPDFVPRYPASLPHSAGTFEVHVEKFSRPTIETFMKIEKPEKREAPPESNHYHTIGQFYAAIEDGMKRVCAGNQHFVSDRSRQVPSGEYYGSGGEIIEVRDLETALAALDFIAVQGEGSPESMLDGDASRFHQAREYAHYFRFSEIYHGRYYDPSDQRGNPPSGEPFDVDWEAAYDMRPDPRIAELPPGEVRDKSIEFSRAYQSLLAKIGRGLNGETSLLMEAVGGMYDLKYLAIELMKIPTAEGKMAGPTFEFPPAE